FVEQGFESDVGCARRRQLDIDVDTGHGCAAAHQRDVESSLTQRARQYRGALEMADAEQVLNVEKNLHRRLSRSIAGVPSAPSRKSCTAPQSSLAGGLPRRSQPAAAA